MPQHRFRKLILLISLSLLIGAAACDHNVTVEDKTSVIAEAHLDIDQDGRDELLIVRMTNGQLIKEEEPGPYQGSYHQGQFQLELVAADGTVLHTLDLNPSFNGEPLIFHEDRAFDIVFEDYNNDGRPDFTIGQYFSSNGFMYNLYSIHPDGISVLHQDLLSAHGNYSIQFEKVGQTSFRNRYYDNKQGQYIDTLYTWQGSQFVRTECEGCDMPTHIDADDVDNNDEKDHTAIEEAPAGPPGELSLTMGPTAEGFRLTHDRLYAPHISSGPHISPPIDGVRYAVHVVRRDYTTAAESHNRRDAVVVNSLTGHFNSYLMYEAKVDDLYNSDSLADAYGVINDGQLLYVAVVTDESRPGGYYYRVEKMNVLTGETSILLEELPDAPIDDHFGPGWLNDKKNTLILNSYNTGLLWSIDVNTGDVSMPDIQIRHSWPFYLTIPSPDGQRFWHADLNGNSSYKLYNLDGNLLAAVPFPAGYDQYPAFRWSPDNRYAAYHDTMDGDGRHIIDDSGEMYIIAPQRIRFFDESGKLVRTLQSDTAADGYIELSGWIDGVKDTVLLHEFELDRSVKPVMSVNSQYRMLNIRTGQEQALQAESELTRLKDADPARLDKYIYQHIHWVDRQQALVYVSQQLGFWLTEPSSTEQLWYFPSYTDGTTYLHIRDSESNQIHTKELPYVLDFARLLNRDWIVDRDMTYIQLPLSN